LSYVFFQPPVLGEQVPDDDRKKFEQEFNDYREKLEQAKEEYAYFALMN